MLCGNKVLSVENQGKGINSVQCEEAERLGCIGGTMGMSLMSEKAELLGAQFPEQLSSRNQGTVRFN